MSWFEKHLNWSLFLAVYVVPGIIFTIFFVIFIAALYAGGSAIHAAGGGESEIASYVLTTGLPFLITFFLLLIGFFTFVIIVTMWYLGQKARSKWWTLLLLVPAGFIILLVIENQATGQGAEFAYATASDQWPDSGPPGGYDSPQTTGPDYTKELDYSPSQNVMDVATSQPTKDIKYINDVPGGGSGDVQQVTGEALAPQAMPERSAGREKPQMPILLDDSGAVITCAYHVGAEAVNLCSRCRKYVCIDCNYITGTHPICRNCWERRAEVPLAPPQKVSQGPRKPEKKKKAVEPPPPKPEQPLPVETEEPRVAEVSQPVATEPVSTEPVAVQLPVAEPTLVEPVKPVEQVVQQPVEPEPQPIPQLAAPIQPEYAAPAEPEKQKPVKPEKQKAVKPEKAAKEEAERKEWQSEFMSLYQQAAPIIHVVVSKSTDGMPGSPLDLMEGLKLRPMLERVKKLSKPKDKEMREAKGHLEQLLSSCIKIADAAANFISGGGQALLGGPDFKRITEGIETANGFMEKLSQDMAAFPPPQE